MAVAVISERTRSRELQYLSLIGQVNYSARPLCAGLQVDCQELADTHVLVLAVLPKHGSYERHWVRQTGTGLRVGQGLDRERRRACDGVGPHLPRFARTSTCQMPPSTML